MDLREVGLSESFCGGAKDQMKNLQFVGMQDSFLQVEMDEPIVA